MENRRCPLFQKQAEELFNFYDRQRIGIITKKALLSYFRSTFAVMKISTD